MGVIYLKHPLHGEKVACGEIEAQHDRSNGWEDFDPSSPEQEPARTITPSEPPAPPESIPSFLTGTPEPVESDLPADFPGREELIRGGLATWGSIVGKTSEELQLIKGVGPATAKSILDVMES